MPSTTNATAAAANDIIAIFLLVLNLSEMKPKAIMDARPIRVVKLYVSAACVCVKPFMVKKRITYAVNVMDPA